MLIKSFIYIKYCKYKNRIISLLFLIIVFDDNEDYEIVLRPLILINLDRDNVFKLL